MLKNIAVRALSVVVVKLQDRQLWSCASQVSRISNELQGHREAAFL